jgi:hypothetical protein
MHTGVVFAGSEISEGDGCSTGQASALCERGFLQLEDLGVGFAVGLHVMHYVVDHQRLQLLSKAFNREGERRRLAELEPLWRQIDPTDLNLGCVACTNQRARRDLLS